MIEAWLDYLYWQRLMYGGWVRSVALHGGDNG
jgi:hypothetical protein